MTQAKSLLYMKLSFQQYVFGKVENYLETNDIFTVNLDYGPNRKFIQHELMQFFFFFFFKLGFTSCKAEQPLKGMKLQEKETQKY